MPSLALSDPLPDIPKACLRSAMTILPVLEDSTSHRRRTSKHHDAADCPFIELVRRLPFMACAVTRRRFPVGASPTRQPLQPEAIGAVMEVTKWLKPSISVSRIGGSASVQAATRVNAE